MLTEILDPDSSALLALQRAAHVSVRVLSAHLAALGLTGSEINAMANLADGRARAVSDLAAAAGIRGTTMTSVLDRLEQRGLIRRGPAPSDRRAVLINLTSQGRPVAETVMSAVAGLERQALARLPADDVAGLRSGLSAFSEVSP
ncbi:MAG TPA: MarR family transcriptional regulator [Streptosporangiaceae bacterium]